MLRLQRAPAVLFLLLSSRLNHKMNRWEWLFIVEAIAATAFQRASQIGENALEGKGASGSPGEGEDKPRLICPVSPTSGCGNKFRMRLIIKQGKMLLLASEGKLK